MQTIKFQEIAPFAKTLCVLCGKKERLFGEHIISKKRCNAPQKTEKRVRFRLMRGFVYIAYIQPVGVQVKQYATKAKEQEKRNP